MTDPAAPRPLREFVSVVGAVIAPATLITAILFYFGWIRTAAFSHAFGLDPSLLDFSVTDYVLRSVSAIFWPAGIGLGLVLVAYATHVAVHRWVAGDPGAVRRNIAAAAAAGVGAIVLAIALARVVRGVGTSTAATITPIVFGLGIGSTSYAVYLWQTADEVSARLSRRWRSLGPIVTAGLLTLAAFWAVGAYAQVVGQQQAHRIATDLRRLPAVVLYSTQDLGVDGPGVDASILSGSDALYHYRYSGLFLLMRAADTFFLLPAGWSSSEGFTVAVKDTPSVRLDLDAG